MKCAEKSFPFLLCLNCAVFFLNQDYAEEELKKGKLIFKKIPKQLLFQIFNKGGEFIERSRSQGY